jgi:crossover junction endodeoxyribonuclease RusA
MQQVDGFSMRIECVPVPKERPRLTRYGGFYTPAATVEFERLVAASWREQQGDTLIEAPVILWVNVGVRNMKKDIDNMVKSIADGLNGVAWVDDRQIVELHAWKYPADKGSEYVNVIVRAVEE